MQARLSEFVISSAKEPVLILRDGEPVAMLVGLDRNEKRTPLKLRDVLERAWKDYEEQGGHTPRAILERSGKGSGPVAAGLTRPARSSRCGVIRVQEIV